MPKGQNQKAKLLHLARILESRTDEGNPMTIVRMMELLQAEGVEVRDRKSLYDDLETLRVFGMDIETRREGRSTGYFVASRAFELPELKLLVDSVQSAKFITDKKTPIATIPIGYADGFRRTYSNGWEVMIRGKKVPIIGKVCMDSFMADVTDIDDVEAGDDVYIWDNDLLKVEDIAKKCNTINYEIISTISSRVPRIFVR